MQLIYGNHAICLGRAVYPFFYAAGHEALISKDRRRTNKQQQINGYCNNSCDRPVRKCHCIRKLRGASMSVRQQDKRVGRAFQTINSNALCWLRPRLPRTAASLVNETSSRHHQLIQSNAPPRQRIIKIANPMAPIKQLLNLSW